MTRAFDTVDYIFAAVFFGMAVYGVYDMFGAAADGRGWILPCYAIGVCYALFCALRALSSPAASRRARAERERAWDDWHAS